jgi:hypothetical protein
MSDVLGELARVQAAFDRPTLRLLDSKWASLVITVFRSAFSRDRRTITAERLHAQVDAYLAELVAAGQDTPPSGSGRQLCLQWMRDQWLLRTPGDDGEEYSLTSHALEALDIVASLSRDRALVSESRLTTILAEARRSAMFASPDVERRLALLDTQIAEITAERDRIAAGGEVDVLTDERLLDQVANLLDLVGALPSDFKRVEEAMQVMHRLIMQRFREEARPIGEVITDYLARSDNLIRETAEGRAFDGAFILLRDEDLLLELRDNLATIVEHPSAQALTRAETRELTSTVSAIRQGTDDVLAQRHKLTATLREHIVSHSREKERELDELLRSVNRELARWMTSARPRSYVPIELTPGVLDIEHLRTRFHDPAAAAPPPPLEDTSDDAPEPPDLEAIRKQGGPAMPELRAAVRVTDARTAAAAFNALPDAVRRPVEILGLLHLLADGDALATAAGQESYHAIRPDGTPTTYSVPVVPLHHDPLDATDLAAADRTAPSPTGAPHE